MTRNAPLLVMDQQPSRQYNRVDNWQGVRDRYALQQDRRLPPPPPEQNTTIESAFNLDLCVES